MSVSVRSYAKLLVDMYGFPNSMTDTVVGLLTAKDKESIKHAIAALSSKPSGERLQIIVRRYFGIESEPLTFREIGKSFDRPISGARVGDLRWQAQKYMRKRSELRPVVERINDAGIKGDEYRVKETLRLPAPEQMEALRSAGRETMASQEFTSNFLLDCLPTCTTEDPCPTCRAHKLLNEHGLGPRLMKLAEEWRSGPSDDWRSFPIETAGFSVRTNNCLLNEDVRTLGPLSDKTEHELLRVPNFGRKSLEEVKEFLASIGQGLRQ